MDELTPDGDVRDRVRTKRFNATRAGASAIEAKAGGDPMSGVILLVAVGLWAVVGRWVWRDFVRSRIPERRARAAGIAFAVAWFVVPVGDEILGAYHFKRLCAEIPPTRYYGPIAVGPGAFFDEQGNPRW